MNRRFAFRCLSLPLAMGALALAGCGGEEATEVTAVADHSDPLMAAMLAERIMIDPDMVDRNGANQLAAFPEAEGYMPRPDAGPEAAAAAREDALALIGGAVALRPVPAPEDGAPVAPPLLARCAAQAEPGFRWSAMLPDAFPIYPRGAVLEAAGSDASGCPLRLVSFATAVAIDDVLAFYVTRAEAAGYTVRHSREGQESVLSASGQGGGMQVIVTPGEGGLTMVDLVTVVG